MRTVKFSLSYFFRVPFFSRPHFVSNQILEAARGTHTRNFFFLVMPRFCRRCRYGMSVCVCVCLFFRVPFFSMSFKINI